jgi:ABC-type multidrug transport system permease subunit
VSYGKVIITIIQALICLLIYHPLSDTDFGGVQDRQGCIFFILMVLSLNGIQNVVLIFPDERPVFMREVGNEMYSVGAYFWSKIFSEIPFSILIPFIFGAIVYYPLGLNSTH